MSTVLKSIRYFTFPLFPKSDLKVHLIKGGDIEYRIINEAYQGYPYKNEFSWMIKVSITKDFRLSFNKYDKAFNKIESKLIRSKCHLIHRYFREDRREIIFYSKENSIVNNGFKEILKKLKNPNLIRIEAQKDTDWQLVSKYIV